MILKPLKLSWNLLKLLELFHTFCT